ncbi:MAG: sulfatase [Spirochaetota bacterium]
MSKPNVVVFISHDTGRFLSTYGYNTVDTPNFERLARMGTTFDNAWCTTPLCAPARAALLTGLYPHQNGMMGLPGDMLGGWDLETKDRHLARVFAGNGYESVLCGFEHETRDFWSVGFETSLHGPGTAHNGGRPLEGVGESIGAWLAERRASAERGASAERPFYLQVGCHETHREWSRYAEPFAERGVWKAPYLIDSPDVDREMAEHQGAVNALDRGVGEILDALETAGELENTILVFTTDHGIDFPRAKGTLFDPGVEVFLFMAWAGGGWRAGERSDALVSHVDLYPTILEACGIGAPGGEVGRSMLPLVTGEGEWTRREAVYHEKIYHDNYDPIRALRTDRYRYILNFDAQTLYDVRIATAPRYTWFRFPIRKSEREELYDLEADPVEANNLAGDADHQDVRDRLKRHLAAWMAATDDPLLDGPVPSPYHLRVSAEMKGLAAHGNGARVDT